MTMSMTPGSLVTVAFADLKAALWGAAVVAGQRSPVLLAGADGKATAVDANVHGIDPANEWRIAAGGAELIVTAVGEPVTAAGPEAERRGFDQLCRVEGRLPTPAGEREVAALGIRGSRDVAFDADGFAAVREVAAWFEPGDGLALAAFRPRGAKGQDADVISAAVLDAENSAPVEDARLSTTYAADGWATRAGLELWLGGDEDQQLLRRAAGEAIGARACASAGDLELRAELFRWHSGGRDGAGIYLLTTRR